jgi:hypothetical protein
MRLFLAASFLILGISTASAGECFDISGPQKAVADRHGSWERMSPDQWQFLRGISAFNPRTPPGIPFGDAAVLIKFPGSEDGEIFFLDGDQVCTPMMLPKMIVDLLVLVGKGTITHEGQGM